MIIDDLIITMPTDGISQNSIVDERIWDAITLTKDGGPPPEFAFPWWLVGLGAAAAVAIRIHQIMKRKKLS
jgi:hypothetical protein